MDGNLLAAADAVGSVSACPTRNAAALAGERLRFPDCGAGTLAPEPVPAAKAETPVLAVPFDPDNAAIVALDEPGLLLPDAMAVLGVLDGLDGLVLPRSVLNVWLILTSCSRLLTCTSWLTYWVGSTLVVGSWFCSSVTSRVKKSLAVIVAALALALELLELLVLFEPLVPEVDVDVVNGVAVLRAAVCSTVWCFKTGVQTIIGVPFLPCGSIL